MNRTVVEPTQETAAEPTVPNDIQDYDNPEISVTVSGMDSLVGKVFTHSELLGLTDRQRAAYQSTLRQIFWDWYNIQLSNPSGLADPSRQARRHHGIEQEK